MRYLKSIARWVVQGLIGLVMIVFFAAILIDWAVGCGETYVDSKGKTHKNECVFLKP